jgi:hypothetical protein
VGGTIGVNHASHWWDNLCRAPGFIERWKNSPQQELFLTMGKIEIKEYHANNGIFGSK